MESSYKNTEIPVLKQWGASTEIKVGFHDQEIVIL